VREQVRAAMLRDLHDQDSAIELRDMTEEQLVKKYGRSRETCRKARHDALSAFKFRQIPTEKNK
jgi:hypothetical protein